MQNKSRPSITSDVARQLRKEAGFGCARCGAPFVEYHHIIPWSVENHFRPEDMVALCSECHRIVGKWSHDRQYNLKKNPHNIRTAKHNGVLHKYDLTINGFWLGSATMSGCPVILQYKNIQLISYELEDDEHKLNITLLDKKDNIILKIVKNNIEFQIDKLWDYQYHDNKIVIKYEKYDIGLTIDCSKSVVKIYGNIWCGGIKQIFRENTIIGDRKNTGEIFGDGMICAGSMVGMCSSGGGVIQFNDAQIMMCEIGILIN